MHAVGLHSALAIKRQRKRRDEQRRARERRYSSQSGESGLTSPRASAASLDQHLRHHRKVNTRHSVKPMMVDSKVVTSIGMLHIGVVFLVLGFFLLISGLLPNDFTTWNKKSGKWWNELVAIGLFAITLGCFLVILNRVIAKKEEDDLEEYVQRQLTRSKSGHRLEKDIETGGLTTKHAQRAKQLRNIEAPDKNTNIMNKSTDSPTKNSPPIYSSFSEQETHPTLQSPLFLEQLKEEINSNGLELLTENNVDPISNIETKLLLKNKCNLNKSCRIQLHQPLCVEVSKI